MQGLIQILTRCLPADDRQIWNVEQGEDDLPVHHCLLYLGLWHHHPLPILPGCFTLIQMSTLLVPDRKPCGGVQLLSSTQIWLQFHSKVRPWNVFANLTLFTALKHSSSTTW